MRHAAYEPGDLVWVDLPALARHKLSPKWTGPFKGLRRLDSGTGDTGVIYELLDQLNLRAKPKVIHYNCLKPYRSPWAVAHAPSPALGPALPTPSSGPPPLTALSCSRPYTYQGLVPTVAQVPDVPQIQDTHTRPVQVRDSSTAVATEQPAVAAQPPSGLRTKSGRCVRPPERYRPDT